MYDFLLVAPHGHASHSLIHYLNQHPDLEVAPYLAILRNWEDVGQYERAFRPWIKSVGISTKHFSKPHAAAAILNATQRSVMIQVVRDPVETFVSIYRAQQLADVLYLKLDPAPPNEGPIDPAALIDSCLTRYLNPTAASDVFEADKFQAHILVDVLDLRGDGAEVTVKALWNILVGNADVPDLAFKPLGSSPYHMVRTFLNPEFRVGPTSIPLTFRYDGDHMTGYHDPSVDAYVGHEERIYTFPEAMAVLPNCGVAGPLHLCAARPAWSQTHPKMRPGMLKMLVPHALQVLNNFNTAYAEALKAVTFSLDDLTPAHKDLLKAGLEGTVTTFAKRHPAVVERWKTTTAFLGS